MNEFLTDFKQLTKINTIYGYLNLNGEGRIRTYGPDILNDGLANRSFKPAQAPHQT